MNCDDWKTFLQDYVTEGLSPAARATVDRHLSECPACFSDARAWKRVENLLEQQPALEIPPGLVDRIVQRNLPVMHGRFRRELVRVAAAALVAVGLGSAFAAGGLESRVPTAPVQEAVGAVVGSFQQALDLVGSIWRG